METLVEILVKGDCKTRPPVRLEALRTAGHLARAQLLQIQAGVWVHAPGTLAVLEYGYSEDVEYGSVLRLVSNSAQMEHVPRVVPPHTNSVSPFLFWEKETCPFPSWKSSEAGYPKEEEPLSRSRPA